MRKNLLFGLIVWAEHPRTEEENDAQPWFTVEGLFSYLHSALRNAQKVTVKYDPQFGFPTWISVDHTLAVRDDEITYEIKNFTSLMKDNDEPFSVSGPYDAPSPPAGVSAGINVKVEKGTGKVIHRVRLSWDEAENVENVLTYIIHRSDHPDGQYRMLNSVKVKEPFFLDTSVENGRTYYYRITAMDNKFRESQPSAVAKRFVPRIR